MNLNVRLFATLRECVKTSEVAMEDEVALFPPVSGG